MPKVLVNEDATSMDGDPISVGTGVGWKSGHEQYGTVVAIRGSGRAAALTISVYDSNTGERHNITQPASRCWVEG